MVGSFDIRKFLNIRENLSPGLTILLIASSVEATETPFAMDSRDLAGKGQLYALLSNCLTAWKNTRPLAKASSWPEWQTAYCDTGCNCLQILELCGPDPDGHPEITLQS